MPEREKDHGFDAEGYQRKEAVLGVAECPTCGKDVELVAETEEWVERDGRKVHNGYGPAQGVCCDLLIVDSWDGCEVYDLGGGGGNSTAEMSETPGSDDGETSSKIDVSAHDADDDTDEWEWDGDLGEDDE